MTRVLLVDDDVALLEELADGVQSFGFNVLTAGDAVAALAVIAGPADVAVVMTDLLMPGLSGLDLAERLLAGRGEAHAIEVVILTGRLSELDAARAARLGVFATLGKVSRLRDVSAVLAQAQQRALERRRAAMPAAEVA